MLNDFYSICCSLQDTMLTRNLWERLDSKTIKFKRKFMSAYRIPPTAQVISAQRIYLCFIDKFDNYELLSIRVVKITRGNHSFEYIESTSSILAISLHSSQVKSVIPALKRLCSGRMPVEFQLPVYPHLPARNCPWYSCSMIRILSICSICCIFYVLWRSVNRFGMVAKLV